MTNLREQILEARRLNKLDYFKEYYKKNKDYYKQYHNKHKLIRSQYNKEYYKKNKDRINAYRKNKYRMKKNELK